MPCCSRCVLLLWVKSAAVSNGTAVVLVHLLYESSQQSGFRDINLYDLYAMYGFCVCVCIHIYIYIYIYI